MRKRTIAKRIEKLCLPKEAVDELVTAMEGMSDHSTLETGINNAVWCMAVAKMQHKYSPASTLGGKFGYWSGGLRDR